MDRIKESNPVVEVMRRYGVGVGRGGRRTVMARCPFHDDRKPSLSINPNKDKGLWYCHVCDMGGDVVTFVQAMERVGFVEACRILSGGRLPEGGGRPARDATPERQLSRCQKGVLDVATRLYHATLTTGDRGPGTPYAYLVDRGLSMGAMREFQIGYCSGDRLIPALEYLRCGVKPALDVGLLQRSDDEVRIWELFDRRIVLVERDAEGQVVHMAGRALPGEGAGPKYLFLPGVPKPAYGLSRVDGSSAVFVVEGIFDYITLHQWGYRAVAALGTSLKGEDANALARCPIAFLPDNDQGGAFALRHWRRAVGHGIAIALPDDVGDVNDLVKHRDPHGRFLDTIAADTVLVGATRRGDAEESVEQSLEDLVTLWRWGYQALTITGEGVHRRDIPWLRRALRAVYVVGTATGADQVARWRDPAADCHVLRLDGVAGVHELAGQPDGEARFRKRLRCIDRV